jgi:hypothetical protein
MSRQHPGAWEPLSRSESAFLCFNVSATDTVCFSTPHDLLFFHPYCSSTLIIPSHHLLLSLLSAFDILAALRPFESWTIDIVNNDNIHCPQYHLLFINFLFIHCSRWTSSTYLINPLHVDLLSPSFIITTFNDNLIRIFLIKIYKLERPLPHRPEQLDLAGEPTQIVTLSQSTQKSL